jgi:DNA-binding LacI/PurR family transcriptional regulator
VANALKALALQSVNAIVFESPDMAQQALQYLQSNHLSNMEGMDFSCIGWDRDLTFAQPKVHGVDYAPSQLAAKVSQILYAALKNPRDASHAPNETLYQLFPEKH